MTYDRETTRETVVTERRDRGPVTGLLAALLLLLLLLFLLWYAGLFTFPGTGPATTTAPGGGVTSPAPGGGGGGGGETSPAGESPAASPEASPSPS